jgi:protease I
MSKLTGLRVAVLATDGFEESELTEPVKALKDAGAQVTIVSLKPGQIQGVRHDLDKTIKIKVDHTIGNVNADNFDAVHLPGGTVNADSLRMVPEVQAFLRAIEEAGKPIAAICHAPWELVSAGLVPGRTLTSYHTQRGRYLGGPRGRRGRQLGDEPPARRPVQTSNRRFRDDEFLVPRDLTEGRTAIRIRIQFLPVKRPLFPGYPLPELAWSEIRYSA